MSGNINNLFNFQPTNILNVTSSYTIPTGYFAQVTLKFLTGSNSTTPQTITINGSAVLANTSTYLTGTTSVTSYTALYYLGQDLEGITSNSPSTFITTAGLSLARNNQMPTSLTVWLKSGDVINGTNFQATVQLFLGDSTITGFKPFNFQPESTVIASSSYTIPANKYAYVTHYFYYQAYTPDAIPNYAGVSNITLNGSIVAYIKNKTTVFWHYFWDDKSQTSSITDYSQKNYSNQPVTSQYWAKAGDVISGSGNWRAIISIYPNI